MLSVDLIEDVKPFLLLTITYEGLPKGKARLPVDNYHLSKITSAFSFSSRDVIFDSFS